MEVCPCDNTLAGDDKTHSGYPLVMADEGGFVAHILQLVVATQLVCHCDFLARKEAGDEAGRGPLAGPVVTGAVILPEGFEHAVLTDSKKLSPKVRESLYEELTQWEGLCWASGRSESKEIDQINILKATHVAKPRSTPSP